MKNEKTMAADIDKLSFEDALAKLEALVDKMEGGKMPLDEMMKCFEEGSSLAAACEKKLKSIEKKIEVLVKSAEKGEDKWQELEPREETPKKSGNDELF